MREPPRRPPGPQHDPASEGDRRGEHLRPQILGVERERPEVQDDLNPEQYGQRPSRRAVSARDAARDRGDEQPEHHECRAEDRDQGHEAVGDDVLVVAREDHDDPEEHRAERREIRQDDDDDELRRSADRSAAPWRARPRDTPPRRRICGIRHGVRFEGCARLRLVFHVTSVPCSAAGAAARSCGSRTIH